MKRAEDVRRELRELRRLTHHIEAALKVKENHEKRIAYLLEVGTAEAAVEAEKVKNLIGTLRIEESIAGANELEGRYMAAIGRLDRLDRTIILEGYISGKPYWKIGKEIGYSERGVQERTRVIVEKLSKML